MDDRPPAITSWPLALVTGQRWSLAIIAALATGPRRFSALRTAIPGLSANLLTRRLEAMTEAEIVERVELPAPASVPAYALTAWGAELGPILTELERWAQRSRPRPPSSNRPSHPSSLGAYS